MKVGYNKTVMVSKASNDSEVKVDLLTDAEIYRLHLRALGIPKRKYCGLKLKTYQNSSSRRILTVTDAFLYIFFAMCGFHPLVSAWCLFAVILCVCNVNAGPLSFSARLANMYLDTVPMQPPSAESIHVGSPESMSLIADYLMTPLIQNTNSFIARCQSERVPLERLIDDSVEIESRIIRERESQESTSLLPLYNQQVRDAHDAIQALQKKRDEILGREERAHREISKIQTALGDLRVLAHASYQLRVIKDRVLERTQPSDEDLAKRRLENLCIQIESAQDNVASLTNIAVARARASDEVQKLCRAG